MNNKKSSLKVFLDTANEQAIRRFAQAADVHGFTTNPSLMRAAGVTEYKPFAQRVLRSTLPKPVSFEVLSDSPQEVAAQALEISSWSSNVYVKVPVIDREGNPLAPLLAPRLWEQGVKLNVTAVFTLGQVEQTLRAFEYDEPAIISIFAGRIADTGRDPIPIVRAAVKMAEPYSNVEILWASCREVLNINHANRTGCGIITLSPELYSNRARLGMELDAYSKETVTQFYNDGERSGFRI